MKASELREKSENELYELKNTLRHQIFELRGEIKIKGGTDQIRRLKRDVARILTVLREKSEQSDEG